MDIKGKGAMETFDIAVEAAAYFYISPAFQASTLSLSLSLSESLSRSHTLSLSLSLCLSLSHRMLSLLAPAASPCP